MKLGFMGWWKGKNEGDNYIKYCLKRSFSDYNVTFLSTCLPTWTNLRKINKLDFLIIGGGGLFIERPPPPFNTYLDWKHKLKVPFGFLGIGVQEINPKLSPTYQALCDDSIFFSVRDEDSHDLLRPFSSNILVAPDLTFLYPRTLPIGIRDKIGVNLRVWNFDEKRSYDNKEWCKAINDLPNTKKTIPLSFLKNIDDREAMKNINGEKNKKFDMMLYSDVHIMIGMRYHSIIFAVQNFIPSIGISYTPKVRRLFSAMYLDRYCLGLDEYDELENTFFSLVENFEYVTKKYLFYTFKARKEVSENIEKIKEMIKNEIL